MNAFGIKRPHALQIADFTSLAFYFVDDYAGWRS